MPRYAVHLHPDVRAWAEANPRLRPRLEWLVAQLATRGQAGRPKGVVGVASQVADLPELRWRRSGVSGSHYYAWWCQANGRGRPFPAQSIILRAVRHHDETNAPLAVESAAAYRAADFHELRPLGEEQQAAVASPAAVRLLVGHPGTGKTGALLFAAWEEALLRPEARLLYVTLSARLASEAREFFEGLTDELRGRVDVATVDDLLGRWAAEPSKGGPAGPDDELEEEAFYGFLRMQPPRDLRHWQGAEASLWTEVRAYVIGRALPFELLSRGLRSSSRPLLDRQAYFRLRRGVMDQAPLDQAWELARKFVEQGERDSLQLAAWRAWQQLAAGKHDRALQRYAGFLVDELQDLTLLQTAALAEAARRGAQQASAPPLFVAAGDESQIVHPSGFEWGLYKDVLKARLGSDPQEFQLRTAQRSPGAVVQVIDRSLEFYDELDRGWRPRGNPRLEPIEGGAGQVSVAVADEADPEVGAWLETLRETPHVAIVRAVGDGGDLLAGPAYADLCFTPAAVKGLDRDYVVLWDASEALARLREMLAAPTARSGPRQAEARRAIDSLRVAISRSTETLVFIDRPGVERDPFLADLLEERLATERTVAFLHDDLSERGQDAALRAQGFLDDALELLERDPDRALRVLVQADAALNNVLEADERRKVLPTRVRVRTEAARLLLRRERYAEAAEQYAQIAASYRELGDQTRADLFEVLEGRYREAPPGSSEVRRVVADLLRDYLDAWQELPESERWAGDLDMLRAWRDEAAAALAEMAPDAEIEERVARLTLRHSKLSLMRVLYLAAEDLADASGEEADRASMHALTEAMGDTYAAAESWAEALLAYQALPAPPAAKLAVCFEGLGRWQEAAERHLAAGQRRSALENFRRAALFERAAVLAREQRDARLAEALEAAAGLAAAVEALRGEHAPLLNGAELEALARRLEATATALRQAKPPEAAPRKRRR